MPEPSAASRDVTSIAVVAGASVAGAAWLGAELSAAVFGGGTFACTAAGVIASLTRLPSHLTRPADAWPSLVSHMLPGAVPYWACTIVTLSLVAMIGVGVMRVVTPDGPGLARRDRLGVDTRSRLARRRDLAPLLVRGPASGRFVVGRIGRRLVATEHAAGRPARHAHAGDRSAVAVIGPTRCGKTANTISGILDWDGPAILSSVKTDLLGATIARRRQLGTVKVFDPTSATQFASSSWSPLRAANTVTGAQKAARALADAAPQGGAENLNFFLALARQLLWPILYAAAIGDRTMCDVVRWTLTQDRPTDDRKRGEVFTILDEAIAGADSARRVGAAQALTAINAIWQLDERTRGSTYATCQTTVEPWQDPDVAAAATGCDLDLKWLLGGNRTLYICGPTHEQQRLATVFGGLLGDLVQQAYDQANLSGKPLPPTLLVLDEAGNTPTRWLPSVASTCSGIGLQLVTVWQSKAQIDSAYGRLSDSVITNHGTKIIFAGVSDPSTLDFAAHLLGEEDVVHRAISTEFAEGRTRVDESARAVPLVPIEALRRMRPGNALLLHGTLRPAHLRSRPYWRDRRLAELARAEPASDA